MKRKVKIALIDSGINGQHSYLQNAIVGSYEYSGKARKIMRVPLNICNDKYGHGTLCASAIYKECSNVEIYSYKILDDNGIGSLLGLECTLLHLIDLDIDIINLSLSIESNAFISDIHDICRRLQHQGKLIIVALQNKAKQSYPAVFPCCYGVMGMLLEDSHSFWFHKSRKIQLIMDNTPFFHCNKYNDYTMFGTSNSYAAARVTGIISTIINQIGTKEKDEIEAVLHDRAERRNWSPISFRAIKRHYMEQANDGVTDFELYNEIEKIVRKLLKIDSQNKLTGKILFSPEVGLNSEHCWPLIKELERELGFTVKDYTLVSKDNFYTINNLGILVQNQMRNRESETIK